MVGMQEHAVAGGNQSFNRIHFSFTLSGHLLFGVGFEHGFSERHALQVTVFPLILPGKGFPFAFHGGYNYYTGGSQWKGKLGAGFVLLVSPPDPQERKVMPMLLFTPGVQYGFDNEDHLTFQPWLAYFLGEANRRFAPIGLEFIYNHKF